MKISFSKLFDNKRFLMFFSLALAIIAWLITVTAINPNTRDEIDGIEVNIAEAPTTVAILEPLNLNIVEGAFATVSAVVEGPRYIVGGLSGSDIDVVAELSGIPVEELVAIENGADCRLDYLRLLCDLYGIRMSSIFHPLTGFDMER